MTLKHMLLGTAAASGIMLAATAIEPAISFLATEVQAATNVSVNIGIGTFYDHLAPYGNWVSYNGRFVWLPEDVSARWRPYTVGHWAYTRRYGWLWVSNERFGWATYHYGRWGYARDIGWYWVPGRRWAPAWVAWNRSGDDIAWAPLPPDRDDGVNISISFGDIPDYYWQAVPAQAFLSVDISGNLIGDRDRVRHVIQRGKPQTVRIENNIVVNNVIAIDFIEKRTNKKVVVLEERPADSPDAADKADGNSVAIFSPEVTDDASAKPVKSKKVEEVVKEREAKGIPQIEQSSGLGTALAAGTDGNAQQPKAGDVTTEETVTTPKKDKTVDTVAPQDSQQNADQQNTGEQAAKKNAVSIDQQGSEKKALQAPAGDQIIPSQGKQKKNAGQSASQDKKNKQKCDPAVQECPSTE